MVTKAIRGIRYPPGKVKEPLIPRFLNMITAIHVSRYWEILENTEKDARVLKFPISITSNERPPVRMMAAPGVPYLFFLERKSGIFLFSDNATIDLGLVNEEAIFIPIIETIIPDEKKLPPRGPNKR